MKSRCLVNSDVRRSFPCFKMSFGNVQVIDPYVENGMCAEVKLTLASEADVDVVEREADFRFPTGYREYVTSLGRGEYCNYIRIHLPKKVLSEYRDYQAFLEEYWFWD